MSSTIFSTNSEAKTREYASRLSPQLRSGDIITLQGDLGAGKTTFVKGLASGLGVVDDITSPTFTIMNVYEIQNSKFQPKADPPVAGTIQNFIHIDTYRLKNDQELLNIGANDYIGQPHTVTVIEWPEKIINVIQKCATGRIVQLSIDHAGHDQRHITVKSLTAYAKTDTV